MKCFFPFWSLAVKSGAVMLRFKFLGANCAIITKNCNSMVMTKIYFFINSIILSNN